MEELVKDSTVSKNLLSASLSPELVQEHRVHTMVVHNGDTVAILRGNFQDVEGKVSKVDRQRGYIYIEGVTREKADGSTRQVPIHSSKVVIRRLDLDDKRRKEILQRRAASLPEPKKEEKPKSRRRGKRAKPAGRKGTEKKEEK
jgi:ribosomal protein uL24